MADFTSEELRDWGKLIRKVAYQTSHDFPYVEVSELIQEMWLGLLKLQEHGKLLTTSEANAESSLRYVAQRKAWKERREHLTISDQYGYRTSDVRNLFDYYYDRESWLDAPVPDDAQNVAQSVLVRPYLDEDGELQPATNVVTDDDLHLSDPVQLEMMSDISRAYDRLDISYKRLLFRHHVLHEDLALSEKKKLSRAYARMADILNYPRRK